MAMGALMCAQSAIKLPLHFQLRDQEKSEFSNDLFPPCFEVQAREFRPTLLSKVNNVIISIRSLAAKMITWKTGVPNQQMHPLHSLQCSPSITVALICLWFQSSLLCFDAVHFRRLATGLNNLKTLRQSRQVLHDKSNSWSLTNTAFHLQSQKRNQEHV